MPDTPEHDEFADFFIESGGDFSGLFGDDLFTTGTNDFFSDVREDDPRGIFFNALNQADLTPNQLEFFENDQQNIIGQFAGILDQALAEGRFPTETFAGFVGQPGFFGEQFRRRAPQQRAAPFTRVLRRN